MSRDEIAPMVPMMPTADDASPTVRADGGHGKRYDNAEVAAPLVPDLR